MQKRSITVVGAGITGLWQALTLARRGHRVRLIEQSAEPFARAASRYAGAMLGPYCETEAAAPVIRDLGLKSMALWRETFPGTVLEGTLVLAAARDKGEVDRFARLTEGHETLDDAAHRQARARSGRPLRRRPVLSRRRPRADRGGDALPARGDRARGRRSRASAPAGRRAPRPTRPSSTAAASAPPASCPTCAAYAASASWCAAPR